MKKKKSFILHTKDGDEVVVTSSSFDYCYGNPDGTVICLTGEEFIIQETPSEVSNFLDEMED